MEAVLPPIPRRPAGALLVLAAGCFLLGVLLALLLLGSPQPPASVSSPGCQDFEQHAAGYWRMLLPDSSENFEDFVETLADSLRARPLGQPCLTYFLSEMSQSLDLESLWLEFGVWRGHSLGLIGNRAKQLGRRRKVFGFDSFRGLPEEWRNSTGILGDAWAKRWTAKGAFDLDGEPPEYFVDTEAVSFVVGWFNESLPPFLSAETGQVSLVHIDSDLYSSAATVLELVAPRLRPGAALVFDELINYPGFRDGEARALYEWLQSPAFRESGLTGVQVVGYRGPNLLTDEGSLATAIREQRGEGRKYPQDAVFRVW